MKKSRLLMLVLAVLAAALLIQQWHSWRKFQWQLFREQISGVHALPVVLSLLLVYCGYLIRAWRWKIFLQPVRATTVWRLLSPTIIGFSGLALLGRPGEMARVYLIARRERLSVASQLAIWTIERVFDLCAFAILIGLAISTAGDVRSLPYYDRFRAAGVLLLLIVLGLVGAGVILRRHGRRAIEYLERRYTSPAAGARSRLKNNVIGFCEGLEAVSGIPAFFSVATLSLVMWVLIALAYWEIIHAFPPPLSDLTMARVLMLIGFGMMGSLVQLPGVGASQLVIVAVLVNVFDIPWEQAVSCGILLWLTTFMAPVPVGLALLRHEHLSLRRLSHAETI